MSVGALPENVDGEAYFFTHNAVEPIPMPATIEEAEDILPSVFEFGLIDNSPILNLEDSLMHVYNMLLSYNNHKNETFLLPNGTPMSLGEIAMQQKITEQKNKMFVRDEFLIQLQKFTQQITRTVKQIEGND